MGDHGMESESRDDLAFSLDPETLDEGSAEEKAGFGTIKVVADGHCLTEGFDGHAGCYREGPLASGYHLAEWLVWNWWRLRWEPTRPHAHRTLEWALAHRMSTIGEGYVWPNVTIDSDGFRTVLTSERSSGRNSEPFRPFRYFGGPKAAVPAKCLESAIDRFASEILERLGAARLDDTNLHRLWRDLRIEREDPAVSRFRRLEALLGRDPDEADAKEIERCLADAADLGEDALEEVAAGAEPRAQGPIDMLSAERIEEIAERQGFDAKPADAVRLDSGTDGLPAWGEVEAWRVGEAAAGAVRHQEKLGTGLITNARLTDLAGTNAGTISDHTKCSDELAFALDRNADGTRIALRSKWETGRRFELARLIGDRLFGGARRLFPATQAYSYRQKAQRTFAAELLSPFEEVDDMLDGDTSDERQVDIARHYQVSPMTIRTLLVNNGRIPLQDAPDLLDRIHY